MKIAIVGTGIAGNVVAYHLRRDHDITVFEASAHAGGHSNTVDIDEDGQSVSVDTGFIVFNDRTYPNFIQLLEDLGQPSKPSVMSFSVSKERTGLEYCGSSLNGLFADRSNLLRPSFIRMVRDIVRFNSNAVADAQDMAADTTVGDYLERNSYSEPFARDYLIPMAAAIWSAEPLRVLSLPLGFLVRFFDNHGLLQLSDRPTWRVVEGGSKHYVERLIAPHRDRIRLSTAVQSIARHADHVEVHAAGCEVERYDRIFLACHADQALGLLADPSNAEHEVLSAIPYQTNEAVLHTDTRLMPRRRRAWAAWNYHLTDSAVAARAAVTYSMNILQGLSTRRQYCVTLNKTSTIAPEKVLYSVSYDHPVFGVASAAAQARHREVNSGRLTYYCGAYWRNGFHEDGVHSALTALDHFNEELQGGELHIRRAG